MSGRAHHHQQLLLSSERKGCGSGGTGTGGGREEKEWPRLLLLCLVSSLIFSNSAFGGFVFDDREAIQDNPDVRLDTPLTDLLRNDFWGTPLTDPESHKSYRPVTTLTFRWNRQLFGMDPFGFHVVNILLHSCVCMMFYLVLVCALDGDRNTGFMAALLFTVHPVHTEAVASVVGRAEILSSIFYLLSIYSFLKFLQLRHQQRHSGGISGVGSITSIISCVAAAISVPLCALIAMLSKEQGITCLGICLVWYSFKSLLPFVRRKNLSLMSLCVVPLFLCLSILSLIFFRVWIVQGEVPTFTSSDNPASFSESRLTRMLTYLYIGTFNFWLLLCPSRLCFDWSMGSIPLVDSVLDTRNVCTASLLALLTGVGSYCSISTLTYYSLSGELMKGFSEPCDPLPTHQKRVTTQTTVLLGLVLMVVPFLPASNLFFPVGFVVAERVLYLPSMGFCLLIGVGLRLVERSMIRLRTGGRGGHCRRFSSQFAWTVVVSLLLVTFSLKTILRNFEWKDTLSLATSGLKVNPLNAKIHATVGNTLVEKGDRQCELYYSEALRLNPNYTMVWSNLGLVYLNTGRPRQAEECYLKALSIQSDHINANTNMGHLCRLQSRWKEALQHFIVASSRRPNHPTLNYYTGLMYMKVGNIKQAEKKFRNALYLNPNYPEAHFALGKLLSTTTQSKAEAISQFQKGLQLSPDSSDGHLGLGILLFDKGEYELAEEHLIYSLKSSSSPPAAQDHEARSYLTKLHNMQSGKQTSYGGLAMGAR